MIHPVPIYLGCAGLIVGSLGLGATYMVGGPTVEHAAREQALEQPLFAKSVEEAALPATRWPSRTVGVAHHDPMLELATQATTSRSAEQQSQPAPAGHEQPHADLSPRQAVREIPIERSSPPATREPAPAPRITQQPVPQQPAAQQGERQQAAAPQEVVRDPPRQQARDSAKRSKKSRRTKAEAVEDDDPREAQARAQQQPRTAVEIETVGRGTGRFERRERPRTEAEADDRRPRSARQQREDRRHRDDDRRQREPERRVVREVVREPEPRIVRGPEQGFGFSPFRLFGIFD